MSVVDLTDAGCPQVLQPDHQRVEAAGLAVDVHVQAVLVGLALGYVLEEQPSPVSDAAGVVERVIGMADRGVAAEGVVAVVLDDRLIAHVASGQQTLDEGAGVFHLVVQRRGPEVREDERVRAVDDELPTQGHVTSYSGYIDSSTTRGLTLRSRTGAAYRFDPGALCLELLTTGGPGPYRHYEVLHRPADLARWAEQSRLTPTPVLEISDTEVTDARRLRDALFGAALTHARGESPAPDDLEVINEAAAHPPLAPMIGPSRQRQWAHTPSGTHLLATVARDAVELLTGPFAHRIRTCAAEDCNLVYVDTSRPGRRRWCSMEHCGNRHKMRSLRARHCEEG